MNSQWNDTKINKDNEQLRIGYYACQKKYDFLVFGKWGINIRSKVDCDELIEYVKNFGEEIVIAKKNAFLWTDNAQNEIIEDIKEKSLNRIVASAWTPRTHEVIYRGTITKTDLNPYYFQMVNVREHCRFFLSRFTAQCKIGARIVKKKLQKKQKC